MSIGKEDRRAAGKYLVSLFVLLTAASLLACVAVIPIIYYSGREGDFVVTAQIERDANEVWEAAILSVEKQPNMKILERDDEEFILKGVDESTGDTGRMKVTSIGEGRSQVISRGQAPEGDFEAHRRVGVRIIQDICNALGVEYTLVEG